MTPLRLTSPGVIPVIRRWSCFGYTGGVVGKKNSAPHEVMSFRERPRVLILHQLRFAGRTRLFLTSLSCSNSGPDQVTVPSSSTMNALLLSAGTAVFGLRGNPIPLI